VLLFAVMSALEIIEQIKALPPKEQAEVVDFVQKLHTDSTAQPQIKYADPKEIATHSEKIFDKYDDLFRKLAK
jgi:hypothetical protein